MDLKEIGGVAFGYEFKKDEFALIAQNLRRFAHAAISAEIRANSPNTIFGRKVNLYADVRHERALRHAIPQPTGESGKLSDVLIRLRQERDQIRALLSSEAPIDKEKETNVVLGVFTTQVAFDELANPIKMVSPELHEPDRLIALRNVFLANSTVA